MTTFTENSSPTACEPDAGENDSVAAAACPGTTRMKNSAEAQTSDIRSANGMRYEADGSVPRKLNCCESGCIHRFPQSAAAILYSREHVSQRMFFRDAEGGA